MSDHTSLRLRVQTMSWQTPFIISLVLESLDRRPLPTASPGAHLDLRLAPGLSRSYSIVGNQGQPYRYELAVARDAHSRGGSKFIHETLRVGAEVETSLPRNLFALADSVAPSILVAGGIGITPIWSMVQHLEDQHKSWLLLYAARSRTLAAYLEEIEALVRTSETGQLLTHFDDEHEGRPAELSKLLEQARPDAHVYCCGPEPMLAAFETACAHWPATQVHRERFSAAPVAGQADHFKVVLQRSGQTLDVPPGRSILDVVLDAGVNAQYGCMQGSCGLCQTAVLSGTPVHLDLLLTEDQKAANDTMLICCSRSQSAELLLDL